MRKVHEFTVEHVFSQKKFGHASQTFLVKSISLALSQGDLAGR